MEMKTKGRKYFKEKDKSFLQILFAFTCEDTSIFSSFLFEEDSKSMDPICWWKAAHSDNPTKVTKEFLCLATSLLRLPSSTAGIERNFSKLGAIFSDGNRNRLAVEKADKICFICNSFKG